MTELLHSPSLESTSKTDSEALAIVWGQHLKGEAPIGGAKNAALVIMARTLLCSEDGRIRNLSELTDISSMIQILQAPGVTV